jgi:ferredoxin-NADP reductase
MGDFVLPMDPAIPLVFIAIGVGITPFHSIIKYLVDKKQHRNITLLYSASSGEEIIFQDLIGKAWINSSLIIRDKSGLNQSKAARLTGLQVLKSTEPPKDSLFYLAGPEQAVEDLQKQLVRLGVDLSRLVIDNFTGY